MTVSILINTGMQEQWQPAPEGVNTEAQSCCYGYNVTLDVMTLGFVTARVPNKVKSQLKFSQKSEHHHPEGCFEPLGKAQKAVFTEEILLLRSFTVSFTAVSTDPLGVGRA